MIDIKCPDLINMIVSDGMGYVQELITSALVLVGHCSAWHL